MNTMGSHPPCLSTMTSSNGSIFRVTGPLCGEFIDHRWIPLKKTSDAELWCFMFYIHAWTNCGWTPFYFMYDPKCSKTFPWFTINAPAAFAWYTINVPAAFSWCTNHFAYKVVFSCIWWNGVHPLWNGWVNNGRSQWFGTPSCSLLRHRNVCILVCGMTDHFSKSDVPGKWSDNDYNMGLWMRYTNSYKIVSDDWPRAVWLQILIWRRDKMRDTDWQTETERARGGETGRQRDWHQDWGLRLNGARSVEREAWHGEWMSEWVGGWMSERVSEWVGECMREWMSKWVSWYAS